MLDPDTLPDTSRVGRRRLGRQHCVPCSTGDRLDEAAIHGLWRHVSGWQRHGDRLVHEYVFRDFLGAMRFLQAVGRIAQREDHHPDLHLTDYRRVRIELTTHAAKGLTRNDFILAARIDDLVR